MRGAPVTKMAIGTQSDPAAADEGTGPGDGSGVERPWTHGGSMSDKPSGRRVTVAVGLINGSSKTGSLLSFDPSGTDIQIESATRAPGVRQARSDPCDALPR